MKHLTPQDILVLHARIIDKTGGSHGIRDTHLLVSIAERPKTAFGGKKLYQTVFSKAAAYLESLVRYHIFIDGNKRTGITVSARFLFLNGYKLTASNKEVENFVIRVAIEKIGTEVIADWFCEHSQKIGK